MEQSANKTYASKVVVTSVVNKDKYRDIVFNLDGGVMDDNVYHYIDGRTYDLLPNPTKDGYVFGGWYNDSEFSNKVIESDIVNKDVVELYAKWIDENFTVTFDYNYLENDIFDQYWYRNKISQYYASNEKLSLIENEYGTVYHFDFEITEASPSSKGFQGPYFRNRGTSSNITLTTGDYYVFQFEAKANKDLSMAVGPEQDGHYLFDLTTEWKRCSTIFKADDNVYNSFVFYSSNYFIGEKAFVDVRNIYISEGDSLNVTTVNKKYNTELGEMPQAPQRDGYRFVGWYDDPINGNRVDSNTIIPYSDDGKFNVYARWLLV
jgi:uncharacterized repeat protein (TIGR02543 family)